MVRKSFDRFDALHEWIKDAQAFMNIAHWEVSVQRDAAELDAWADIAPHSQAFTADLRVSHDFWKQSPEKQRAVLTHELTHLIMAHADRTVDNLEDALGKLAWAAFSPQYEDASERATEHVALLIASQLPLPELGVYS